MGERQEALFASGKFNQVPLMIGTNRDEYAIFGACANISIDEYRQAVLNIFGGNQTRADAVLGMYNPSDFPAPRDAAVVLESDIMFCDSRRAAGLVAGNGLPTYR